MDRTAWIAVILCSLGMVATFYWQSTQPIPEPVPVVQPTTVEEAATPVSPTSETTDASSPTADASAPIATEIVETIISTSKVDFILSSDGGGIRRAELTDMPETVEDGEKPAESRNYVTKNRFAKYPIGALSNGPKQFENLPWAVVSQSPSEVTYKATTLDNLAVTKRFSLPKGESVDPHLIQLDIQFENKSGSSIDLGNRFLYLGASGADTSNELPMQIGAFWKPSADDMIYKDSNWGKKGWFSEAKPYGIWQADNLQWAGSNNQFFTTIAIPTLAYDAQLWTNRFPIRVPGHEEQSDKKRLHAIESAISLPAQPLAPGNNVTISYGIFTGPKEYRVLKELGGEGGEIQQIMNYHQIPIFGKLFGWIIKPVAAGLIILMVWLHSHIGSWGWSIISMTVIIRLIMWPLYAKSAHTMKRMSKLAPKMTELKEKYKDDPQKLNQETMGLYRQFGVNPLGGCLPMLVQMPIFLSFYRMLWSAVELRHEGFWWIDDLSMPDFFMDVFGFPLNLLPILMAITTFVQMAMTPKTGDPTQRMIFMLMPVVFLVICYNFASALALYWTTSNLWTIGQTWLMKKLPEPELKKNKKPAKKGFFAKLQEKAEAMQEQQEQMKAASAQQQQPNDPRNRTKLASEKGSRHTKSKRKKRK